MDESMETLTHELSQFKWDSEKELVLLTKQHILRILQLFLAGQIKISEIEDWANAIECREDIGREKSSKDLINEIMHELANPELTTHLSKARAKILYDKLI